MNKKVSKNKKNVQAGIDLIEEALLQEEQVNCPVQHIFTPGLYTRQIFMPKGTFVTSKIHRTEHPFFVSVGKVKVYTEETGWLLIEAPFMGITKPNTRRVLFVEEDTVWSTCHVTDKTDVAEIENDIIIKREDFLPEHKVKEVIQ